MHKNLNKFDIVKEKKQYDIFILGICIARSLKIPRETTSKTFEDIIVTLIQAKRSRVVVMFVNEDNSRKLLKASIDLGVYSTFYWLASDSWGAKIHPVVHQEYAAEGAVTILPKRQILTGNTSRLPSEH